MPDEAPRTDATPKTLAYIVGGGLVAGTLIVMGAVLPAEYNVDPLGIGKATGLSRLWAPDTKAFAGDLVLHYAGDAPRTVHLADIPLGAAGWDEASLEYKVFMVPGQSILYRWSARTLDGKAANTPIEYDMHGHDLVEDDEEETVVEYAKGRATSLQGSLAAPMEGIFGWYFRNQGEDPVIIRLEVEGYFSVIPPGEPGNEFRIRPLDPAAVNLDAPGEPS